MENMRLGNMRLGGRAFSLLGKTQKPAQLAWHIFLRLQCNYVSVKHPCRTHMPNIPSLHVRRMQNNTKTGCWSLYTA
jgi:hypothetical protein